MANEKRLIDANALMRYIEETHPFAGLPMASHICTMELLTYAPTVDAVEVVHGRWIWNKENECWVCGNCEMSALNNYRGNSTESNYCPNCGAKMDMEVEE